MSKKILWAVSALTLSAFVPAAASLAQDYAYQGAQPQNNYVQPMQEQQDPVMEQIRYLQSVWAKIKYQMPDETAQVNALHQLEAHAAKVTAAYPQRAEPKIWEAIILSTDAGIDGGLGALGTVKKQKLY